MIQDFTRGNVTGQLLKFAAPLYASNMLQIVYNVIDMIIVGQMLGAIGLSAVAIGGDVANFLTFVAMGFAGAGQVIIAQLLGAGQRQLLGRFITGMIGFQLMLSVAFSLLCLTMREPILRLMNTPPETWDEALVYATVTIGGLIFIYGYNTLSAVLRGLGDSKHPFIFVSISATLNIILDAVFVIGFELGAGGAALATVLSQCVSFSMCATFLYRHRAELSIEIHWREFIFFDRALMSRLLKLGVPMAIKSASIHFTKLFVASWLNSYGVAVAAFAGVANKIGSMSILLSNALNTAGATMVGQNIGAGQYDRVRSILIVIARISFAIAAVLSAVMMCFPTEIYGAFTDDAAVLSVGMEYLPIAVLIFFGSASRAPMNALINGSGHYVSNFMTALFDGFVMRVGLSVLFGLYFDMKYLGFWFGDALAGFTPLIIGTVLYLSGDWKKKIC